MGFHCLRPVNLYRIFSKTYEMIDRHCFEAVTDKFNSREFFTSPSWRRSMLICTDLYRSIQINIRRLRDANERTNPV